jgi:5-bromo-4-chloroindolyl phosphate hydrolysis protein
LREVNEAIERGQWPSSGGDSVRFRCECAVLDCNETIGLTIGEYERLRQDPRRFVLVPGHELPDVEIVVENHDAYIIVEKQKRAGEVAEDLDPRRRST